MLSLRHHALLTHAQFWGEDGPVWYKNAYDTGAKSLLAPHTGYLQTISRLVALAAQALPVRMAPTMFATAAVLIEALPPALVAAAPDQPGLPPRAVRALMAAIYLALPNAGEVQANLTNSQWHLACAAFLILILAPPVTRATSWARAGLLLLAGLSGPFCIFLAPIALWQFAATGTRQALRHLVICAACVAIQAAFLLHTMTSTRTTAPLGAGVITLLRILVLHIELGAVLGVHTMAELMPTWFWRQDAIIAALATIAAAAALIAVISGGATLRKWTLFGALLLAAALLRPQVSNTHPQWPVLAQLGAGDRYFFIPMLVWLTLCLSLTTHPLVAVRAPAIAFFLLLPIGIIRDWSDFPRTPTNFTTQAKYFAKAPPGTTVRFQVQPPAFPPMILTKHH